jgi:hypothetical protein
VLRVLASAACIAGLASSGSAQSTAESDAYAWVQYGADGQAHVRVIPSDRGSCPEVTGDGFGVATTLKVPAGAGFDRMLCDAALPPLARGMRVGVFALPPVPERIGRFVVLGDTGCRIDGARIQDCRDNRAWPFARIARAIAAEVPRPDLIVHVGGYQYRQSPCPAGDARCAGSPDGDTWMTWAVELFEPGAPLFATAPLIFVRGDREDCAHAGLGWSRYLAAEAQETCTSHDAPVTVSFVDLRFVNVDSASGDENESSLAPFLSRERSAGAAELRHSTILLTHRPPLAYLAARAPAASSESDIAAILAGHLNLFAALSFAGAPPALIVGNGGATLDAASAARLPQLLSGVAEARFGYAVFDRVPGGWTIS